MNEPLTRKLNFAVRSILSLIALSFTLGCADGDDGDDCDNRQCNQPPAAFCTSDGQLAAYDAKGTCQIDECAYALRLSDCADEKDCADGRCVETP